MKKMNNNMTITKFLLIIFTSSLTSIITGLLIVAKIQKEEIKLMRKEVYNDYCKCVNSKYQSLDKWVSYSIQCIQGEYELELISKKCKNSMIKYIHELSKRSY